MKEVVSKRVVGDVASLVARSCRPPCAETLAGHFPRTIPSNGQRTSQPRSGKSALVGMLFTMSHRFDFARDSAMFASFNKEFER